MATVLFYPPSVHPSGLGCLSVLEEGSYIICVKKQGYFSISHASRKFCELAGAEVVGRSCGILIGEARIASRDDYRAKAACFLRVGDDAIDAALLRLRTKAQETVKRAQESPEQPQYSVQLNIDADGELFVCGFVIVCLEWDGRVAALGLQFDCTALYILDNEGGLSVTREGHNFFLAWSALTATNTVKEWTLNKASEVWIYQEVWKRDWKLSPMCTSLSLSSSEQADVSEREAATQTDAHISRPQARLTTMLGEWVICGRVPPGLAPYMRSFRFTLNYHSRVDDSYGEVVACPAGQLILEGGVLTLMEGEVLRRVSRTGTLHYRRQERRSQRSTSSRSNPLS